MNTRFLTAALLFAFAALSAPVQAQAVDDPDQEIFKQFVNKGHWDTVGCRTLDAAYNAEGHLFVAMVEWRSSSDDRLIVAQYDPASGTTLELIDTSFYMDEIREVAIVVPPVRLNSTLKDRWYVAVVFANKSSPKASKDLWVALISGIQGKKWGPNLFFVSSLSKAARADLELHPTVACVPRKPSNYTDYSIDVSFMWPEKSGVAGGPIYRISSFDYGYTYDTLQQVAGPKGKAVTGPSFGHPSLAGDEINARALLAFEDRSQGVVHVASGRPGDSMELIHTTPSSAPLQPELAPAIAANEGRANLLCLAGPLTAKAGRTLVGYYGQTLGGFLPMKGTKGKAGLHEPALSPPDVERRGGDVYFTVLGLLDGNATRMLGFEGDWDTTWGAISPVRLDDPNTELPDSSPKVAATPFDGSGSRRSYVWLRPMFTGQYGGPPTAVLDK